MTPTPLRPEQLHWICDQSQFPFQSTMEIPPLVGIIGQDRAMDAIRLGAEITSSGYNIFVSGALGSGRLATVQQIIREIKRSSELIKDYCYVHNFNFPDEPHLLIFPKGNGKLFQTAMNDAISLLRKTIPQLFEQETFRNSRQEIVDKFKNAERETLHAFDAKIRPMGFVLGQIELEEGGYQPEVFPVVDGKPIHISLLNAMVEEGKLTQEKLQEFLQLYSELRKRLTELGRISMKQAREVNLSLAEHDRNATSTQINGVLTDIKTRFESPEVIEYLEQVEKDIYQRIELFQLPAEFTPGMTETEATIVEKVKEQMNRYAVNVVLDNSLTEETPIVIETSPSMVNLFGTIERKMDKNGSIHMDFSNIKAGSFLKADGGFIILSIADLTIQTWQTLQRVLQYKRLEIQAVDNSTIGTLTLLKPEPIEPNVKVILIGDQRSYYSLYFNDDNFKKIFKVLAEFNYETELNSQMIEYYAKFIARVCVNDNLPHCDRSGVAAILEWAVSKTETQNKISLIFSDVGDITREAAYYANQLNSKLITREFVEKAVENRRRRNSVYDEKVKTRILNNTILIDTSGSRVGQINGLTVSNTGLESFGQPVRITATAGVGNAGIVTIEREAELSGKILDKGSMIVYGFFLDRFARTKTFTLTSHVAFEQTYGGVEGDSASAAAVYAIMSAISEVPVNQSLAITGSMNQKGDIQPIGGVNEKIEGFFDICALRGLDGTHAVIIPKQNIPDLMLKAEIIQAVKEQKFAIYPIEKIEDAIPLFFGLEAGSVEADGSFTSDSLFSKIDTKLQEFAKHFHESIQSSKN